jgi:hypothetical protein
MLAAARHSSTMRPTSAARLHLLGTAPKYPVPGRSAVREPEYGNALRSLVRAALAGQSEEAVAAGCRWDAKKVGKLLRGALPMSLVAAERLAEAADDECGLVASLRSAVVSADPMRAVKVAA